MFEIDEVRLFDILFTVMYYLSTIAYNELVAWRQHANAVELRLRRVYITYVSGLRLLLFLLLVNSGEPSSPSGMKFCHEILETYKAIIPGENPKSLIYHVVLKRYQVVTPGQTDRQNELP